MHRLKARPSIVAFDVVETLFSLEPMRERLRALGLSGVALEVWFARLLRNAFALDASGTYSSFGEVARGTLEVLLVESGCLVAAPALDQALEGFSELPAFPDVAPTFQLLQEAGVRIITLTNGQADNTHRLLESARLDRFVERVISIDEVRRWKPAREVYLHAAAVAGVAPRRLALVAAHAWDIHGASHSGLVTGWVSRLEKHFLSTMNPPDVTGDTLPEVARRLLALPQASHSD